MTELLTIVAAVGGPLSGVLIAGIGWRKAKSVARETGAAATLPHILDRLEKMESKVDDCEERHDRVEKRSEECEERAAKLGEELQEAKGDLEELRGIVIRRDSDVTALMGRTEDITQKIRLATKTEVRKALSSPHGIPAQPGKKPDDE